MQGWMQVSGVRVRMRIINHHLGIARKVPDPHPQAGIPSAGMGSGLWQRSSGWGCVERGKQGSGWCFAGWNGWEGVCAGLGIFPEGTGRF